MSALKPPLVGREIEQKRIDSALDMIESGGPACIAVEGEPGIGKTRLLVELKDRAEERGFVVLDGMAAEFEGDVPFTVMVDALDAYLASHAEGIWDEWDPELLKQLGTIFPALRRFADEGTDPGVGDRHLGHRAVQRLLERLAVPRPLVILLDDVHWADAASVEVIGALLRRGPEAGVLLCLGYRPGQANPALLAALSSPAVRHLELARLSRDQSLELLGDRVSPGAAKEIFFETAGNPFCLEQLARVSSRTTTQTGANADALAAGIVPAPVATAIADELAALSPDAKLLLDAAAVAGEPFELDLSAEIADLERGAALTALDELLALSLVHPTDVPRRFVFRHPLVRRAVYEAISGGWRLAAHERASELLRARGASAGERASHVEQAATTGDEDAIALLVEAGESALSRAPAAAAHRFEAALRLVPATDALRRSELLESLAAALSWAGELDRARTTLIEAFDLLPPDAAGPRAEVAAACAQVEHWLGRQEEAHARLVDAWEGLSDRGSREAGALAAELAADAILISDFERAIEMGETALAVAEALEDKPLAGVAAAAIALALTNLGQVDAALARREYALGVLKRCSDQELVPVLDAFFFLAWAGNYLELFDASLADSDRGLEIARRAGEGRMQVPLMLSRAHPLEMQGRLEEACAICEDAAEVARLSANPQYLHWALWELAWARLLTGDLEAARTQGEQSAAAWDLLGGVMPARSGEPGWTLGRAMVEAGDVDAGLATMLPGVGGSDLENVVPPERSLAWLELCLAEIERGKIEEADGFATRSEANAAELGLAVPAAYAARARAAVELARGNAAAAAEAGARSAELARKVGAGFEAARSELVAGRALAVAGERDKAIETLRSAEEALSRAGAARSRDEARRELRTLGARAEPRGPSAGGGAGVDSLTKREREIADLVTDRHTNREIAEKLFLSEKTIETHLRNIFGKLGATSRVEVARIVERSS